jgi:hypothetical protein
MICKDLYEQVHGPLKGLHLSYIKKIEEYFTVRRDSTAQILILPNFCLDNDMTNFMRTLFPDLKEVNIYRGLVVELRPTYEMSLGDFQWLYPQISKRRGIIELSNTTSIDNVKSRIRDLKEIDVKDFLKRSETSNEYLLSAFYNSVGVFECNSASSEWGTTESSMAVGFDLSLDKFLLHFLYSLIENNPNINVVEFYRLLTTSRIEGQNLIQMVSEMVQGVMEYVLDVEEHNFKWITDQTYNYFYKTNHSYFFFNHGVNMLSMNKRPIAFQSSTLAGYTLYKNNITNQHPYHFVFPVDAGFCNSFYSYESLSDNQKERLMKAFHWQRHVIPFNTYLMQKTTPVKTKEWKELETTLQVLHEQFYRTSFNRLSTHNVYDFLHPSEIVKLQPGATTALVRFPLHSKHLIVQLILDNYESLSSYNIINPKFYDERRKMLVIPKNIATIILNKK